MQNVCKYYAKRLQNYAKSIQKIMQKGYSHALHTHIYMDYARHGEIQGHSLALGTLALGRKE